LWEKQRAETNIHVSKKISKSVEIEIAATTVRVVSEKA
jgi:hypothetical protein